MSAYHAMDDSALVTMIRAGNHDAFAELVTRHTDRFFNLAFRSLQNQQDAEDVVQTAFIKFWESPQQWNPAKAKFTTWFYRVVLNACHDLQRRSTKTVHVDTGSLEFLQEPTSSEQRSLEQRQVLDYRQRALEEGMRQLPESQRDALNLAVYCALPQQQVAEIMGVSVKAVESLLVRAKRNLSQFVAAANLTVQPKEVKHAL